MSHYRYNLTVARKVLTQNETEGEDCQPVSSQWERSENWGFSLWAEPGSHISLWGWTPHLQDSKVLWVETKQEAEEQLSIRESVN